MSRDHEVEVHLFTIRAWLDPGVGNEPDEVRVQLTRATDGESHYASPAQAVAVLRDWLDEVAAGTREPG